MRQGWIYLLVALVAFSLSLPLMVAQETTAGLQGTVKDASGAVVSNAHVVVRGSTLVGDKALDTDANGYYRFANLPPGNYSIEVSAKGFKSFKRSGIALEVGHLPTVDIALEIGAASEVVEVSGAAPLIDVTTTRTMTNVTSDVIQDVPHGRSFQSVIQFAPSARQEPLAGSTGSPNTSGGNGTGGQSPGSGGNGQAFGFSVGGGSDSENSYLVEGQETADSIGGFSHTNVPFDFIQEVQIKSSGVEAEFGGALGGVVNVIMKKGGNAYHGSVFSQYETSSWDGSPTAYDRYDPSYVSQMNAAGTIWLDPAYQNYQPVKDRMKDTFPGFTLGGPILKDKIFFFAAFNPEFTTRERFVGMQLNPNSTALTTTPFSQNTQTYYMNGRIDAALTNKIRVYGSWLSQQQRSSGKLPFADATNGLLNQSSSSPVFVFGHNLGYSAPNTTTNVGLDYSITPSLVATVRWGYNFQNYHDFGYPTGGTIDFFQTSGKGATDNLGNPIAANSPLSQTAGYFNVANNQNTTGRDATHRHQINADLAWFKSGWFGTHNFKFGYQMNHLSNDIYQHWNEPAVFVSAGAGNFYSPQGPVGQANCASFVALYGGCAGQYGYINIEDYGSLGKATSLNHGFFAQDSWTVSHGVTINAGLRVEKEYLPGEAQVTGAVGKPINFSWSDKIAPRVGAAWDVFQDGKMKVFGSYGVFYDVMKLNLAISSFGGQYWQNCYYALDTQNLSSILPQFDSSGRFCSGPDSSSQANFPSGTPAGITFLENQNFRTFPTTCATCNAAQEGVAPGLKPYRQHESTFGMDYQLTKSLALEARWDRRRLDHAIEDSAIFNPAIGETFVIVNPGQGIDKTFDGFWNFLYGTPSGCPSAATGPCPPNIIPAARSYDGVELRLTKLPTHHWGGLFSYTYSNFRGNYTGLTSTDIGDGGGGRNAPNNSRSFDEPFFSWSADGTSSSGLLPTDRPNAFKGYGYYELGWKHLVTDLGIFQIAYSGTPQTSIADIGYSFAPPAGAFPVDIVGRGKWVDINQNLSTGTVAVGNPRTYRTPWYTQTDFNFQETYKITESKSLSYFVTIPNLLNQRAITAYYPFVESQNFNQYLTPQSSDCLAANTSLYALPSSSCFIFTGVPAYAAYSRPYNYAALLNGGTQGNTVNGGLDGGTATVNSQYGKPYLYQLSRNIRMGVRFTF